MSKPKWDFRDVSDGLKKLRSFLLGRPHDLENLHARFPPRLSSRTIPPAKIPRGPETKYSNNYYYQRSAQNSVRPPVVAPIAEGPRPFAGPLNPGVGDPIKPDQISFTCAPTPGPPWAWDGHCFFSCVPDPPEPLAHSNEKEKGYPHTASKK